MAKPLTSDDLIKSIKRRAFIPQNQNTYSSDDFLDILNEEIKMFGIPHLLSTYEEYLVYSIDIDLETDVFEYTIPYRSIGNKLREVSIIDASDDVYEMSRISIDELFDYRKGYLDSSNYIYYVKNNKIVFVNETPISEGKIRMHFYLQPNTLVLLNKVGTISGIDRNSGVITLSNFPTTFSSLPKMDFVGNKAPNKIYSYDITPLSTNSTTKTITFTTTDIPTDLEVGDYVCVQQETPVPQLPVELHPILAQRAAVACLEGLGDSQAITIASARLDKMEKSVIGIINNRVEGSNEKINNRHSPLNQTRYTYGNRRRIN